MHSSIFTLSSTDIKPWVPAEYVFLNDDFFVETSRGKISNWGSRSDFYNIDLRKILGVDYNPYGVYSLNMDFFTTLPMTNSNVASYKPFNNENIDNQDYKCLNIFMQSNAWTWRSGAYSLKTQSHRDYARVGSVSLQRRVGNANPQGLSSFFRRDEYLISDPDSAVASGLTIQLSGQPNATISIWMDSITSDLDDAMLSQLDRGDIFQDYDDSAPYFTARFRLTRL